MIMNKHRKRILIILSIIIVAIAAVFVKNYNDSKLPAPIVVPTDIELVKIEHDHAEEHCFDKEWISGLEGLLKDAKPTHRQSVNDSPYADDYYAVTFESETMDNDPFYVYEDDKKTYIEFPYEGIYLADDRMIDHLAVMFPDHLFGKWVCCGIVEEGNELSEENIISGEQLEEQFGADVTGSEMVIGKYGIEGYSDVPGTECGKLKKTSDNEYEWQLRISILDGENLDEPITETYHFILNNGYMFVTTEFDSNNYDTSNPLVYKRAE